MKNMSRFAEASTITLVGLVAISAVLNVAWAGQHKLKWDSGKLMVMMFIRGGVSSQGAGVLQVAQLNSISPAVASATRAEVVAAPASGSTYIAGILVEKSAGGAGTVTLSVGTGTNCGTGTVVLLGPVTNPPVRYVPVNVSAGSANAVCLTTDGASTSARVLYQ